MRNTFDHATPFVTINRRKLSIMNNDELHKRLAPATIPLKQAGQLLGLGANAVYAAAKRGDLQVIRIGKKYSVPTAPLRRMLGIEDEKSVA